MKTKYKGFYVIWVSISIFSLALSVGIVIYLCCSGGSFGISHISFGDASVTVLCTIVGLLVGWQIYKTIEVDNKMVELKEMKYSLKSYVITLSTKESENSSTPQHNIHNYIAAIEYALDSGDKEAIELPLSLIRNMENRKDIYQVYKGEKKRYVKILKKTEEDVEDLIKAINKAREVEH